MTYLFKEQDLADDRLTIGLFENDGENLLLAKAPPGWACYSSLIFNGIGIKRFKKDLRVGLRSRMKRV
jgi:hypothetical protein